MCTLTIAWGVFPEAPVVVAANRDELLGRPSSPPRTVEGEPRIVAPRDGEAGGTWIGYNGAGVFAGLANRWTDADLAAERSRGLLVTDALAEGSAEAAARTVERALDEDEYAGFNLVVADADAAILFEWDGRLRVSNLEPGVHVVLNAGYDDRFDSPASRSEAGERQADSARRVRAALAPVPGESAGEWLDRAAGVLSDHDYGVCVHGRVPDSDDRQGAEYGTRSSSLIALYADGTATYRFADGPPCRTAYEPVEAQI